MLSQDKQATSYRKTISVPVIGYIAAGEPLPTFTDSFNTKPMENLDVPTSMIRAHEGVFALRVRGLSMIDALVGAREGGSHWGNGTGLVKRGT